LKDAEFQYEKTQRTYVCDLVEAASNLDSHYIRDREAEPRRKRHWNQWHKEKRGEAW